MSIESADDLLSPTAYRHPLVRDLCWTIAPGFDLLTELSPYQRFQPRQPAALLNNWLRDLDADPQPLEAFFSGPPQRRLGHHFEKLVQFYLHHSPTNPLQLLQHNRPVMGKTSDGRAITLGELDFLLAEGAARIHLETAVKFYLGVEHAGAIHWLGPGLEDRLTRKLQHLRDHQLPLSRVLQIEPLERHFWLKGVLFHPWQRVLDLPAGIIPSHQTSFWLTCSEAVHALEEGWICLPKAHWLGCAWEDCTDAGATAKRIRDHFTTREHALMLWHERSGTRRLVVADDWSAAARAVLSAV